MCNTCPFNNVEREGNWLLGSPSNGVILASRWQCLAMTLGVALKLTFSQPGRTFPFGETCLEEWATLLLGAFNTINPVIDDDQRRPLRDEKIRKEP